MTDINLLDLVSHRVLGGDAHAPELCLEIDDNGVVTVTAYSIPHASWIPSAEVESGAAKQWTARGSVDTHVVAHQDAISALVDELMPLLERVYAGYREVNSYLRLSEVTDAADASEAIGDILDRAEWSTTEGVVDALDWFEDLAWDGIEVTAETTDAEIDSLKVALAEMAREQSLAPYDLGFALRYRREALRDALGSASEAVAEHVTVTG